MNTIIDKLFERVRSKEERERVRYDAVTDLAFILEMDDWNLSKDARMSRYESLVSKEIIELELDESELKRIVEFFEHEINNGSFYILSAMGKAYSKIGLIPLLNVINNNLHKLNESDFNQALIALENMLFWSEGLSLEEEKEIMSETGFLSKISEKILSLQPISSHVDLESTASRFLARLILLLEID